MAIWQRKPKVGLIVHPNRGSQYASKQYRGLLNQHGFVGSMSKRGDCWDNSVAESFFSRLKDERVHWRNYQTRGEAKQDILDYITMFYNNRRLHSSLDYLSPNQFENRYWELIKKWLNWGVQICLTIYGPRPVLQQINSDFLTIQD